jgi:hypothetical protein
MQCRFCANEKVDYRVKILSLRKALSGIRAEFLMFNYSETFDRTAGPCITERDSEGNVTGFTAAQCVRYTHIKNGWQVIVHPCFEKDKIIFRAQGARRSRATLKPSRTSSSWSCATGKRAAGRGGSPSNRWRSVFESSTPTLASASLLMNWK